MTLRYKLRTLLILLAILPPLLWIGWTKYEAWKTEQEREQAMTKWRLAVEQAAEPPGWTYLPVPVTTPPAPATLTGPEPPAPPEPAKPRGE